MMGRTMYYLGITYVLLGLIIRHYLSITLMMLNSAQVRHLDHFDGDITEVLLRDH